MMLREFIVYACPTGAIASQLACYFQRSRTECGSNTAHHYMPHCTLTGFFHDDSESVPIYRNALDEALDKGRSTRPDSAIAITALTFQSEFHYLKLDSDWILRVVKDFSDRARSDTRVDALRLKGWLHLSLAYGFPPEQCLPLQRLAAEILDMRSPAVWELRFYERHPNNTWTCHRSWAL
ncbi:MAG: hypothetical protein AAFY15_04740 [Cyanobacteria bacterium J06648_11]